jgi:sensor histidine kinase YesM
MKKAMTQKLFITYFIMMLLLVIFAALAFLVYNIFLIQNSAMSNISQIGQSITNQIDMHIKSMDISSINVATSTTLGEALDGIDSNSEPQQYFESNINQILIDDYKSENDIYRITVLDLQGDVFTTGICNLTPKQVLAKIETSGWSTNKDLINGRKIIEKPHLDDWDTMSNQEAISELRVITYNNKVVGYIEVQQEANIIEDICEKKLNQSDLKVAIIDNINNIFYSNFSDSQNTSYINAIFKNPEQYYYTNSTFNEPNCILNLSESNYTDWTVIFILDKASLFEPVRYIVIAIILVVICTMLIATVFIKITIQKITNPINRIVKEINKIDLNNLTTHFNTTNKSESYETQVIYNAFTKMMLRLSESIDKEKALQELQIKTNFDMLQSKIGPHFLYNTLGSIANMCEMGEKELVTNACYDLSDILRYSANYKLSVVMIRAELENLMKYCSIMKCRYRQRLNYTINFDEDTLKISIPKLTIQPLTENAIKYSLMDKEFIYIDISGKLKDGELVLQVSDNGNGISKEQLEKINLNYEKYINNYEGIEEIKNIKFGGMGLMGTFLRLYLIYKECFRYEISVNQNGGTTITIYIRQKEEAENV